MCTPWSTSLGRSIVCPLCAFAAVVFAAITVVSVASKQFLPLTRCHYCDIAPTKIWCPHKKNKNHTPTFQESSLIPHTCIISPLQINLIMLWKLTTSTCDNRLEEHTEPIYDKKACLEDQQHVSWLKRFLEVFSIYIEGFYCWCSIFTEAEGTPSLRYCLGKAEI